ncbi:MAG: hypothetical protein U0556_09835 [Dehalococcoidia bacterium]
MTAIAWSELTLPQSQRQATRARVYVGGPLRSVEANSFATDLATPTTAATTLAAARFEQPAGTAWPTPEAEYLWLTAGDAFLNRGAAEVGGVWFTYLSKTLDGGLWRLDNVQQISGTALAIPAGAQVAQWRRVYPSRFRLSGDVRGHEGGWQLEIEGINWNSQHLFQDASILVQIQQWDNLTADTFDDLTAGWTSWKDLFLGYLDQPQASVEQSGAGKLRRYRLTARGRSKYLALQTKEAETFGLFPAPVKAWTASSVLGDPAVVPEEGGYLAGGFDAAKAGDSSMLTLWASAGVPSITRLNDRGVTPANRRKDDFGLRIQQLYCAAPEGGRWTRQQQLWIEVYNSRHSEDAWNDATSSPDTNATHELVNNLVLENDEGQRVYLNRRNGYPIDELRVPPLGSLIICYDEAIYRSQFDVPEGTVVLAIRDADGYRPNLKIPDHDAPGSFKDAPTNVGYRGLGAEFRLKPEGGWVAIRRAKRNAGAVDIYIDWDEQSGRFGEEWVDVLVWGNATPPLFWVNQSSSSVDQYGEQSPSPWQGAGVQGVQGALAPGRSFRRQNRSAYAASNGIPAAMGGGVLEEYVGDPPAISRYNLDSNTAADWTERSPVIGNENTLVATEWLRAELGEFPAPKVQDEGTQTDGPYAGRAYVEVDDARFFPEATPQLVWHVTTNQAKGDGNPNFITFFYDAIDRATKRLYVVYKDGGEINANTELKLKVPLRLGVPPDHPTAQVWGWANLYQIAGVSWRRQQRDGGAPSVPSHYAVRLSAQTLPNDPRTYLGENPDWLEAVKVNGNAAGRSFHPLGAMHDAPFVWWGFFEIAQMTGDDRAKLNELTFWALNGSRAVNPATGMGSPFTQTYNTADIADAILREADVPARFRDCSDGATVLSVSIARGSVWQQLVGLAKRSTCVVTETKNGVIRFKPDPRSVRAAGASAPNLTVTRKVARGRVTIRERPRHQAAQVEVAARNDADQTDYSATYPAVPFRYGGLVRIEGRYAASKNDAIGLAQASLREANGGWTMDVAIGSFADFELLDVVRVEGLPIDDSGAELQGRDFFITGAQLEFAGGEGLTTTLRLTERRL